MTALLLPFLVFSPVHAQDMTVASTPTVVSSTAPVEAPVQVIEIAFTTEVSSRTPVTRANSFDESAGEVFFWNRILAKKLPTKIRHVWYRNDKKVADYDLNIRYKRTRVWTGKTVKSGQWRVEILDEAGEVVMTAMFPVHRLRDAPHSDPWRQ